MRGHLKSIILKQFSEKNLSGSELIRNIEVEFNWKPSCGSVYPLLSSMVNDSLIKVVSESGSQKVYGLTAKGKKSLFLVEKEKKEFMVLLDKTYKLMGSLYDIDVAQEQKSLEYFMNGKLMLSDSYKGSLDLKKEFLRIIEQGLFDKNDELISKILAKATSDLKKIKE